MKIRTHLTALTAGVMTPLVLLVVFVTYSLWHQQREAYEQRYVERVSALRLALDTELQGAIESLTATAAPADLQGPDVEATFQRRFGQLLATYPGWSAVALADVNGRVLVRSDRGRAAAAPQMAPEQIAEVLRTGAAIVSGLQPADGGRFVTLVAAPIRQGSSVQGIVYAAIDHGQWLQFLKTYPISPNATLVLNDRQGTIIARTLNDDRWVGKRSTSRYLELIVGKDEGAFQVRGLEGQVFYTAFSRSRVSGWVLGTGVPREEVEAALLNKTLVIAVGVVLALAGALAAAWLLGRHIRTSLTSVEAGAAAWPRSDPAVNSPLPIAEAESVRQALIESSQRMLSHEQSLTAAVEREAAAREAAESGSRAKDSFLAMLGHELRNPLSAITSATAVLTTPDTTPAAAARARDILSRQTAHLRRMLGDLIDTAELTRGGVVLKMSRIDLAEVVDRAVVRFSDTGRSKHVNLRLELQPTLVEADARRLEEVVTQLLANACEYTPAGGSVIVAVCAESGEAVLRVTDTGAGIAPELLGQVFETFAQGKRTIERSQGGLGLGLATVKRLVELHGGLVQAASNGLGFGSTFTVRLPGGSAAPATSSKEGNAPPFRLTIVEDLPDTREVMTLLLSTPQRLINVGEDGPSGVAAILSGPSDAAVIDIGLPGFDGHEVARRVRQAPGGAGILLIALTGYGTAGDRTKALAAGFDEFLVKPFDPDLFEATLVAGLRAKSQTAP